MRRASQLAAATALSLAVLGVALSAAAFADWPVYGHDLANSRNARGDGPSASQLKALKRAWTFNAPTSDFTGTPVIGAGVLVAGSNSGKVFALDATSGRLLWSRQLGQQINASCAIDVNASGGPLVLVPVADLGSPRLVALSLADGSPRWATTLTVQPGADVFGSPTFWRGTVYMGTSGPNDDASHARGGLVSLDESTGTVRWHTFTVPPGHDGGAVWSTPAIDILTGRIYIGTGNAYHTPVANTTDSMMELDAATGQIIAHFQAVSQDTFTLPNNPFGPDADFGASPNLISTPGGRLLVGDGAKNGVYYGVDRSTMRPVWRTRIGPGFATGGILSSTAYDGTRIFGTDSLDGQLWSLDTSGALRWASLDPSVLDWSPVALANGILYSVDPLGFLVARNAATGVPLAAFSLGGFDFGGVSVSGKTIYAETGTGVGLSKGSIVALRAG